MSRVRHRRARPEAAIQRCVFQHLRARGAPGVFAFHPANGGYRKPIEAAMLKAMGLVAGVPDVIAIHQGRVYGRELKAEGGKPTPKQVRRLPPCRWRGPSLASLSDWMTRCAGLRGADCSASRRHDPHIEAFINETAPVLRGTAGVSRPALRRNGNGIRQ